MLNSHLPPSVDDDKQQSERTEEMRCGVPDVSTSSSGEWRQALLNVTLS